MAAKAVQKDWEERDFTQTLQLGLSQMTLFLNQFGAPPVLPPRLRRLAVLALTPLIPTPSQIPRRGGSSPN